MFAFCVAKQERWRTVVQLVVTWLCSWELLYFAKSFPWINFSSIYWYVRYLQFKTLHVSRYGNVFVQRGLLNAFSFMNSNWIIFIQNLIKKNTFNVTELWYLFPKGPAFECSCHSWIHIKFLDTTSNVGPIQKSVSYKAKLF